MTILDLSQSFHLILLYTTPSLCRNKPMSTWNVKPTFGAWLEGRGIPATACWSIGPEDDEFGMEPYFTTEEEAKRAANLYNSGNRSRLALEMCQKITQPYWKSSNPKLNALILEALDQLP